MNINEEIQKIEAEMKMLQERFSVLTGAKRAFEMVLNGDIPQEPSVTTEDVKPKDNSE